MTRHGSSGSPCSHGRTPAWATGERPHDPTLGAGAGRAARCAGWGRSPVAHAPESLRRARVLPRTRPNRCGTSRRGASGMGRRWGHRPGHRAAGRAGPSATPGMNRTAVVERKPSMINRPATPRRWRRSGVHDEHVLAIPGMVPQFVTTIVEPSGHEKYPVRQSWTASGFRSVVLWRISTTRRCY